MLCPKCKTELVSGGYKQFETLCDHVCCCNGDDEEVPDRLTVVCPNKLCVANQHDLFWDAEYGEGPYNFKYGYDYQWIDNNDGPFDSPERSSNFNCQYKAENREWRNRWFMITREVGYESNPHGDKVGRYTTYRLWICNDIGSYSLYTSGIHMFVFCVKMFRKADNKVTDAVDAINQLSFSNIDWWRHAYVWYIRIFHNKVYREATTRIAKLWKW
jgi:hypothetical protein